MTIDEFKKIELKVGTVRAAERVEGSHKLLKLQVDLGVSEPQPRQILAGIGKAYQPEQLVGRQIVVAVNLDPRMMMGLESKGMLLAPSDENGEPAILMPDRAVPSGSEVH